MRHGLVIFDGSRDAPCSGDDIQLARAVLRRDRKATAEFVSRYSDDLFAYLARRLSPRVDLAEDLLQEVFLAAWESLAGFEGRSSLRSWLFGIAKHKVEGHYREQLRAPSRLEEDCHASDVALAQDPVLDERLDQERQETRAQEILRALPERYRVALLWRYWERRNAVEMAAATGRSVKAIERLLSRAAPNCRLPLETAHLDLRFDRRLVSAVVSRRVVRPAWTAGVLDFSSESQRPVAWRNHRED